MDVQRGLLPDWNYLYQEKSMDEMRQSVLLSMELEDTKAKAHEELKLRDEEIGRLKEMLRLVIKQRNEAQEKCQSVLLEKLLLQQQLQHCQQSAPHSGISSIEDDPRRGIDSNHVFSSSDCDESIVSSPQHVPPPAPPHSEPELPVALTRPLPEKGRLLQAVMKAGPLLQTLLLAGPLPQWRHPPPLLDAYQIPPPPVIIQQPPPPLPTRPVPQDYSNCGGIISKRSVPEGGAESSKELKYQRVVCSPMTH